MVDFGNLKVDAGLKSLDDHLFTRSYIVGFQPTQLDTDTFKAVGKQPPSKFLNVLRWYNHIDSFGSEKSKFPVSSNSETNGDVVPSAPKDDDDDFDLFDSNSDDERAAEKLKEERAAAAAAAGNKKSSKAPLIAKSTIVLDVKPWDDETDMADIERSVRSIQTDGLLWGASKLVPLAYGIKKLQIGCVVEDDKVGTDFLEEEILKFEDIIQSVDVAAFNKL